MPAFISARVLLAEAFAPAIKPRKRLAVSAWADAHRVLSPKASSEPGPWKTARAPHTKEPMDCLSASSPVQRVVLMWGSQISKTEIGLNWIGYVVDHAPGPMLAVVPTIDVRNRWVKQRLNPMMSETPRLAQLFDAGRQRDSSTSLDIKDFPGGMLVLGGANSPASLASMPIRYVLCDEVDRFPWEAGKEGDPLGLIDQRTATFPRRKVLLVSTPTIKGASRIEEEFERSDRRHYHVPCQECTEKQTLKWANLQWDKALTHAWYVCEHCGSVIEEHSKPRMLAAGVWIAQNPASPVRGYTINGLYAPVGLGFSWIELARQWMAAQGDPAKLKRFVNTVLAEAWEDRSRDINADALAERAEPYPLRTIPPGALILTAGVDVQDDRIALQILGWGRGERCAVIDYVEIPGDPSREDLWAALTEILTKPLSNAYGKDISISASAIDTGGHFTHDVYNYVRNCTAREITLGGQTMPTPRRLIAIKGSATPNRAILPGRSTAQDINWRGKVIRGGVKLWLVGVDTAKHVLTTRLMGDANVEPSGRLVRFSEGLPPEYYQMLTSEAFDPEKNKWVKRRGRRNEALDTWVYGLAAAHHPEIRVHAKRQKDWSELEALLEPGEAPNISPQAPNIEPASSEQTKQEPKQTGPRGLQRRKNFVTGW